MAPTASGADDDVDADQGYELPHQRRSREDAEPAYSTALKGLLVGVLASALLVAIVLGLVALVMAP